MPDIHLETTIDAEPAAVFRALTSATGLASFWTDQAEELGEAAVGNAVRLGFGPGGEWEQFEMRIEQLEPERLVEWRCAEARDPEWPGTTVRWELEPAADGIGTRLRFHHLGWETVARSYPRCAYDWAMVVERLGRYAATGEASPHWSESAA